MLTIGEHTYGNPILRGDHNNITIGKFCSIAEGVILDGGFNHNKNNVSTYPFRECWGCDVGHSYIQPGDINIGNDVWIGEQAVIMAGVTIGHGAIIGIRTIVTKNVEPYEIVVGAPMQSKGLRFGRGVVNQLLDISWWDWDNNKIRKYAHLLVNEDIDKFIEFAKEGITF